MRIQIPTMLLAMAIIGGCASMHGHSSDMPNTPMTPAPMASAPMPMEPAMPRSLFDRLGGQPAIDAVVNDFAPRVLADTRINAKFARTDKDRLVTNLKTFFCMATGGKCSYAGDNMKDAHAHMAVTDGEFNALVEDLTMSLDHFNVPMQEKNELLGALAPMRGDIVERKGATTGTPLPASFKPNPPLQH